MNRAVLANPASNRKADVSAKASLPEARFW